TVLAGVPLPASLTVDALGNLYVAQVYTFVGSVTGQVAKYPLSHSPASAYFATPTGLVPDAVTVDANNTLYVAYADGTIREYGAAGAFASKDAGSNIPVTISGLWL